MKKNNLIAMVLLSLTLITATPLYAYSVVQSMADSVNSGIINTKLVGKDAYANINATVENGVVIFTGNVASKEDVNKLIQMARSVSGIREVNTSRLYVKK